MLNIHNFKLATLLFESTDTILTADGTDRTLFKVAASTQDLAQAQGVEDIKALGNAIESQVLAEMISQIATGRQSNLANFIKDKITSEAAVKEAFVDVLTGASGGMLNHAQVEIPGDAIRKMAWTRGDITVDGIDNNRIPLSNKNLEAVLGPVTNRPDTNKMRNFSEVVDAINGNADISTVFQAGQIAGDGGVGLRFKDAESAAAFIADSDVATEKTITALKEVFLKLFVEADAAGQKAADIAGAGGGNIKLAPGAVPDKVWADGRKIAGADDTFNDQEIQTAIGSAAELGRLSYDEFKEKKEKVEEVKRGFSNFVLENYTGLDFLLIEQEEVQDAIEDIADAQSNEEVEEVIADLTDEDINALGSYLFSKGDRPLAMRLMSKLKRALEDPELKAKFEEMGALQSAEEKRKAEEEEQKNRARFQQQKNAAADMADQLGAEAGVKEFIRAYITEDIDAGIRESIVRCTNQIATVFFSKFIQTRVLTKLGDEDTVLAPPEIPSWDHEEILALGETVTNPNSERYPKDHENAGELKPGAPNREQLDLYNEMVTKYIDDLGEYERAVPMKAADLDEIANSLVEEDELKKIRIGTKVTGKMKTGDVVPTGKGDKAAVMALAALLTQRPANSPEYANLWEEIGPQFKLMIAKAASGTNNWIPKLISTISSPDAAGGMMAQDLDFFQKATSIEDVMQSGINPDTPWWNKIFKVNWNSAFAAGPGEYYLQMMVKNLDGGAKCDLRDGNKGYHVKFGDDYQGPNSGKRQQESDVATVLSNITAVPGLEPADIALIKENGAEMAKLAASDVKGDWGPWLLKAARASGIRDNAKLETVGKLIGCVVSESLVEQHRRHAESGISEVYLAATQEPRGNTSIIKSITLLPPINFGSGQAVAFNSFNLQGIADRQKLSSKSAGSLQSYLKGQVGNAPMRYSFFGVTQLSERIAGKEGQPGVVPKRETIREFFGKFVREGKKLKIHRTNLEPGNGTNAFRADSLAKYGIDRETLVGEILDMITGTSGHTKGAAGTTPVPANEVRRGNGAAILVNENSMVNAVYSKLKDSQPAEYSEFKKLLISQFGVVDESKWERPTAEPAQQAQGTTDESAWANRSLMNKLFEWAIK